MLPWLRAKTAMPVARCGPSPRLGPRVETIILQAIIASASASDASSESVLFR